MSGRNFGLRSRFRALGIKALAVNDKHGNVSGDLDSPLLGWLNQQPRGENFEAHGDTIFMIDNIGKRHHLTAFDGKPEKRFRRIERNNHSQAFGRAALDRLAKLFERPWSEKPRAIQTPTRAVRFDNRAVPKSSITPSKYSAESLTSEHSIMPPTLWATAAMSRIIDAATLCRPIVAPCRIA